jgi:PAS domain-containing protein
MNLNIVCDDGGGITLVTPGYQHYYDYGSEVLGEDIKAYLIDQDTSDWSGNDLEEGIDPLIYNPDVERNGGYRWLVADDLYTLARDQGELSWHNLSELRAILRSLPSTLLERCHGHCWIVLTD